MGAVRTWRHTLEELLGGHRLCLSLCLALVLTLALTLALLLTLTPPLPLFIRLSSNSCGQVGIAVLRSHYLDEYHNLEAAQVRARG